MSTFYMKLINYLRFHLKTGSYLIQSDNMFNFFLHFGKDDKEY